MHAARKGCVHGARHLGRAGGAGLAPGSRSMEMLLVHIALLLYTFGVAAWLAWLLRATPARVRAGRWSMIAGAILHAGALVEGATLVS